MINKMINKIKIIKIKNDCLEINNQNNSNQTTSHFPQSPFLYIVVFHPDCKLRCALTVTFADIQPQSHLEPKARISSPTLATGTCKLWGKHDGGL